MKSTQQTAKKRGRPCELGPDSVPMTMRLPSELFHSLLIQKLDDEAASGKLKSMSATLIDLLRAGLLAKSRARARSK